MPSNELEALAAKVEAVLKDPALRARQLAVFAESLAFIQSHNPSLWRCLCEAQGRADKHIERPATSRSSRAILRPSVVYDSRPAIEVDQSASILQNVAKQLLARLFGSRMGCLQSQKGSSLNEVSQAGPPCVTSTRQETTYDSGSCPASWRALMALLTNRL
jgi:hypothetical protein